MQNNVHNNIKQLIDKYTFYNNATVVGFSDVCGFVLSRILGKHQNDCLN